MLQKYDTLRASTLLAIAVAGGAFMAAPAAAETRCDLSDGYGDDVVSYVEEVQACLGASDAFSADRETAVFEKTNAARAKAGLEPLERRASLDQAARAHALDMAARNYAGHSDLEGRGHVYRMRALDRQVLASATGANVVVLGADASAEHIYEAIRSDKANRENLTRERFNATGLGVAEGNDRVYVVQMLTTVDGELETPLPLQIAGATSFQPRMSEDYFRTAGWNLTDDAGNRLAGGQMMRLTAESVDQPGNAYLDILVELNTDTYVLRGPIVSR
ncbi:CAP domain-containing protein [Henriciella mobilis]|uniref:CAP domain-containing protein n=1 Tax=Henriciella mobilis TaxID=2305467 RepID=UPI000E66BD6A|nr:CAP domain-containing protein [Henriciella mobilis]RIJ18152.1 CAP domain-containing protein [Henriciella mobilis]RIJ25041.1 CAP domain-containing protein [Henriciella mobilis]